MKRQDTGSEATNCHYSGHHKFVDIHVALVKDFDDLESEALVVEPTPRFYSKHPKWVWLKLIDLEGGNEPVRISGWTLYDPSHGPHMGKHRKSMWEIHPITKIEIFREGKWVEY